LDYLASARPAGRFRLLGLLAGLVLVYSTTTRVGLMLAARKPAGLAFQNTFGVLASGAFYDLLTCVYAALPLSLCLLLPSRLWQSRVNRTWWRGFTLVAIYALGFIAAAEVLFWREFQVRFNFIAVDYLVYTTEVVRNIWETYRVMWVLAGNLGLTAIVYWVIAPSLESALRAQDAWPRRVATTALIWTVGLGCAFGLDEGPNAMFGNVYRKELASNGPYQFVRAFRRNELDYDRFYARLPLAEVDGRLREQVAEPTARFQSAMGGDIRRHVDNPGAPRRLNVVMIMVESLSAEFMARYAPARAWTPTLDTLARDSLVFDNFYATGTRTDRGLEAVTLSMPPTPGRSIVKRAGRESNLWSLGNVLDAQGYDSIFVYGGRSYFDNMGAFFGGNGYRVVDQTSVPSDEITFENAWGMADEDIYRQVLKIAAADHKRGQPFFMHVMTTSNHRPYTFPNGRSPLPSGSGRPGAVQYTDWAIGDFLRAARAQPWFDDTVFVILGDHCASSAGKVDLPARRYHVPLIIHAPKHVAPGVITTVSSQIDVAPTLLALLHLDYDSAFFGKDILAMKPADGRALIGNYEYLGLLADDTVTVLTPRRRIVRHPAGQANREEPVARASEAGRRAIAFYQGASHAYRGNLTAWEPPAIAGGDVAQR